MTTMPGSGSAYVDEGAARSGNRATAAIGGMIHECRAPRQHERRGGGSSSQTRSRLAQRSSVDLASPAPRLERSDGGEIRGPATLKSIESFRAGGGRSSRPGDHSVDGQRGAARGTTMVADSASNRGEDPKDAPGARAAGRSSKRRWGGAAERSRQSREPLQRPVGWRRAADLAKKEDSGAAPPRGAAIQLCDEGRQDGSAQIRCFAFIAGPPATWFPGPRTRLATSKIGGGISRRRSARAGAGTEARYQRSGKRWRWVCRLCAGQGRQAQKE